MYQNLDLVTVIVRSENVEAEGSEGSREVHSDVINPL